MGSFYIGWLVFAPLVFAFPVYFLAKNNSRMAQGLMWILCAAGLAASLGLFFLPETALTLPGFCGYGISFVPGVFGKLMALVTSVCWLLSCLAAPGMVEGGMARYWLFTLLTLSGALGVFLSGDLFTVFVFFEVMSMSSVVWVAMKNDDASLLAMRSYLGFGITGGLMMLTGLFLLYSATGTLAYDQLRVACEQVEQPGMLYGAAACLLFGFGAKAGMFPIYTWLPKSYMAAPANATALLSAVLSKTGVFGILVVATGIFYQDVAWGNLLLIFGLLTMVVGGVLALLTDDLKRTLAFSSMSQIGFILVGAAALSLLGTDRALASGGTVLHMLNHSLFKIVLFLLAGGILAGAQSTKLDDLMGYGRKKPFLLAVFLAPALGLGGIPLFSGYVSKTLLHESLVEYQATLAAQGLSSGWYVAAEWIFLLSGGLTLAYMAKLFTVLFLEHGKGEGKALVLSLPVKVGVALCAAAVLVLGVSANWTLLPLADACGAFFQASALPSISLFSWGNLWGVLVSLAVAALLYFGLVRRVLIRKNQQGETVCPDYAPALLSGVSSAKVGRFLRLLFEKLLRRKWRVIPRTNDEFGIYTGREYRHSIITDTLAYELLLCGLGVVSALLYLLLV